MLIEYSAANMAWRWVNFGHSMRSLAALSTLGNTGQSFLTMSRLKGQNVFAKFFGLLHQKRSWTERHAVLMLFFAPRSYTLNVNISRSKRHTETIGSLFQSYFFKLLKEKEIGLKYLKDRTIYSPKWKNGKFAKNSVQNRVRKLRD